MATVWVAWTRPCGDYNWVEGFGSIDEFRKAIPPGMEPGLDYYILNGD